MMAPPMMMTDDAEHVPSSGLLWQEVNEREASVVTSFAAWRP